MLAALSCRCRARSFAGRFVASRLEKNNAVLAFCTDTSQLKMVASPVRKVPRIVGATPGVVGLFTTVMKTWAGCPLGKRMPARVMAARCAERVRMFVTSLAVSLG